MKKDNSLYWIWFTLALGYNNPKAIRLYEMYDDISVFYNGRDIEWSLCKIFTDQEIKKLRETKLVNAEKVKNKCAAFKSEVIGLDDERYPEKLRNIFAPPAVLYVKGEIPDVDTVLCIAVVGSRKCTDYGVKMAYDISYNLAECGVTIISGGALGIDSAAHHGSLKAGGKNICVLGCGLDSDYLRSNENMRKLISQNGAIITEYMPGTPAYGRNFPVRNRIMSGLASGIVVVEAGERSGALITASCAAEQGRDVFAVMGNINSPASAGSNALIKDGAVPVTSYTDILNCYSDLYSLEAENDEYSSSFEDLSVVQVKGKEIDKYFTTQNDVTYINEEDDNEKENEKIERKDTSILSENAKKVYEIINETLQHVDQIIIRSGMRPEKVLSSLTELEINDYISNPEGRLFKIK